MANSENSKFNNSHYAGQRKNLQRKKLGEGITGLTPSHEEATSNKFDGLPENFNETVFLDSGRTRSRSQDFVDCHCFAAPGFGLVCSSTFDQRSWLIFQPLCARLNRRDGS
jgi:hypothetical protein